MKKKALTSFPWIGKITVSARVRDVAYQKYQDVTIRQGAEVAKVLSGDYASWLFYAYVDFEAGKIVEPHLIAYEALRAALMASPHKVLRNTDGCTGFVTVGLKALEGV